MDNMKNKLTENLGALKGLENKSNNENEVSENNIQQKINEIKQKGEKRKIKNVTFGIYEDQQESIREITDKLGISLNEFMRDSLDIVIDLFNKEID